MKSMTFGLVAAAIIGGYVPAAQAQSTLYANSYMFPGSTLISTGCYFTLAMQHDGNLVTYDGFGDGWWASGTDYGAEPERICRFPT